MKAMTFQKRWKSFSRAAKVSVFNAAALLIWWALTHLVAERTRLTTIFTYAPQLPVLLPTFLLFLASLWHLAKTRSPRRALWNGAVLLLGIVFVMGFNLPLARLLTTSKPTSSTRSLRVMTFNIALGAGGTDKIAAVVRAQNPDVLCMQETLGYTHLPDPIPLLQAQLREFPFVARTNEVTTFSRFQIVSWRRYQMPSPSSRAILETVLDVRGARFTVFNSHIGMEAADENDKAFLDSQPSVLKFGGSTKTRMNQAQFVVDSVRATPTPFIVCGDFNIPPRGLVYRKLARELTDSFRLAGFGYGHSFPAPFPQLRIDYMWLNSQVRVLDGFVPNARASDHRPYVADLEF